MEPTPARAAVPANAPTPPAALPPEPLTLLGELVRHEAEGELICSDEGGEVRLYLQGGRVAWASASAHRRAFTAHLKEYAGVQEPDLERVIAGCKRFRLPIGEALVQNGLATPAQVRAALRHQLALALAVIAGQRAARIRFTERQFATYDGGLTFGLEELLSTASSGSRPSAAETLRELGELEGFAGAAVLTPAGELVAVREGDAPRLRERCVVANDLLLAAQRAAVELGVGQARQLHVEGAEAQVLARCHEVSEAHLHLVLVLRGEASLGLAKLRLAAAAQRLAEGPPG